MESVDVLVVGAGIVGIASALQIVKRSAELKVVVLEKEVHVAAHASGRNSGVLHAGFYYSPDSLKARLTRDGNRMLSELCDEYHLPINRCGKLVVARGPDQLEDLRALHARGMANGVTLQWLDESEARYLEPRVRTFGHAIFSPTTSSVDPVLIAEKLRELAEAKGVQFRFGERFLSAKEDAGAITVRTDRDSYIAGVLVNAAGLSADSIAHSCGVGERYRLQPFKGLYLYCNERFGPLRTHVYPVPDVRNPFLGVHFTIGVDGRVKIGPTATPAFWREQYHGLDGFGAHEFGEATLGLLRLLSSKGSTVRSSLPSELSKYSRHLLVRQAASLVEETSAKAFSTRGRPGIRAQLVDRSTQRLVSDFLIERGLRSVHVLNAVSPAFTSSLPFGALVAENVQVLLG